MSGQGILGIFGTHVFLDGLCDRHLMLLASGVTPFAAKSGDILAHEGEPTDAFYLIQSGNVEVGNRNTQGDFVALQGVGPGEVVGWSWLLPPNRWQFECRAADDVKGLKFNAAWLREKCEENHDLGYCVLKHLLKVVAGRLAATRLQLREAACPVLVVRALPKEANAPAEPERFTLRGQRSTVSTPKEQYHVANQSDSSSDGFLELFQLCISAGLRFGQRA